MRVRGLPLAATLLAIAPVASADPRLTITHEPPPRSLRMRPRAVAQTAPPVRKPTPMPAAPPPMSRAPDADDPGSALRDLRQNVSFSLDLGYQVESATPTGRAALGGNVPDPQRDYKALRAYGFGEAFLSTRGLGLASLSTYFAMRFQIAQRFFVRSETGEGSYLAPPIATWFERTGVDARVGWAEVKDFLPERWGLSKLRFRAGGQHVYGPWVTHLDGFLLGYDGSIVTASVYGGIRHSDYTRDQSDRRPGVFGTSLRFDLRGLPTPLPIALQGEYLYLGASSDAQQPSSSNGLLQGDWRPRRDIAMIVQLRTLNGNSSSQRIEVRARYRQVTNLVFDFMHRTEFDWRWDPSLIAPDRDGDPTIARRYLDLGPVVPQFVGSVRAGTLIAENVDLFVRGAFSADARDDDDPPSSYAAPYLELGGALEVRLRRQVALGASLLTRNTDRAVSVPIQDVRNQPQMLAAIDARGEEGFTEVGGSLKMTLGARRFSTLLEIYGRRVRYGVLYVDPLLEVPTDDLRIGGRITLDAWVGRSVRLFAAYDVSSAIELHPEVTGYRSLRLMISGMY
jgi:hypothetical protein